MSDKPVVSVSMGKLAVAWDGETLKTILGSCVGVGILWSDKAVFGLAHCVLPESHEEMAIDGQEARFVNQAIPRLLEQMGARRKDYKDLQAVIIGGASLIASPLATKNKNKTNVGAQNVETAQDLLARLEIPIVIASVGENFGRQLYIDGKTGVCEVHKISRLKSRRGA